MSAKRISAGPSELLARSLAQSDGQALCNAPESEETDIGHPDVANQSNFGPAASNTTKISREDTVRETK